MILFDIGSVSWKLNEYKEDLWLKASIGIPHLDVEANDAVILGFQVATFINEVSGSSKSTKRAAVESSPRKTVELPFNIEFFYSNNPLMRSIKLENFNGSDVI